MDPDLGKDSKRLEESRVSRKSQTSELPSLHHRKEGWPSDQENAAKHPLIARPGWFSDENKRKTTPAASVSVAARNFIDDAATPPCGDARRGITLDSNLFTASVTARFSSKSDVFPRRGKDARSHTAPTALRISSFATEI